MEGEQLIDVVVIGGHGPAVVLQSIWIIRDRERVIRTERIRDRGSLLARLRELVPLIAGELPAPTAAAA